MLIYPNIDPVALHLGPVSIHWYGLMYLFGFLAGWGLLSWRLRTSPRGFSQEQLSDIVFYAALGIIIGGRVGYVLFYDFSTFLLNPLFLFQIWKGGMSFHGGLIGVIITLSVYAHLSKQHLGDITDLIAPVVPIGLAAGRIGNFINGELWGRATDLPWAMIFPNAGNVPRHPSQLYEFFLEGILMFLILWTISLKLRPRWVVSSWFLICYGLFRCSVEFFREPDQQIGFVAGWLTEGQLLSFPMFILGIILLIWASVRNKTCTNI